MKEHGNLAPPSHDARVLALLERIAAGIDGLRAALESEREPPSPLLTRQQLAALLQVDERTLRRLELEREIPPPILIGNSKRWRRADIDTDLAERRPA